MDIDLKLRISNNRGEAFLGPGPVSLLKEISARGSILAAAEAMEMSYAKALRLIKDIESATGRAVVARKTGGLGGGGSELTAFAEDLVSSFEKLTHDVGVFSKKKFEAGLGRKLAGRRSRKNEE
jgi:molybdate transport system regulatory protein